jgi:hypothetical protein
LWKLGQNKIKQNKNQGHESKMGTTREVEWERERRREDEKIRRRNRGDNIIKIHYMHV